MSFDIPEKLYVGVQGKKDFNKTNPPLAFAIPYGTKNWENRKSTVDNWAGYGKKTHKYIMNADGTHQKDENGHYKSEYIEPDPNEGGFIVDNVPVDGFYFEKSVTRYETSNKFFRINDPRGFQLEIDSANLGDILLNSHISKGYLVGKFQWTSYKGKAYLVREDHPAKQKKENPKLARIEIKVGDKVEIGENGSYIYAGKFYRLVRLTQDGFVLGDTFSDNIRDLTGRNNYPFYSSRRDPESINDILNGTTPARKRAFFKDSKPVHAFIKDGNVHLYRQIPKNITIESENNKLPSDLNSLYMYNLQNDYIWRYTSKTILFNSKKELLEAIGDSGFEELEKDKPTKFIYKRDRYVYDAAIARNRLEEIKFEGPDYQILPTVELDTILYT